MQHNVSIAIIGSGNMGGALVRGLISTHFPPEKIWIADPALEKLQHLAPLKVNITQNNVEAVQHADVVIFAVKPQYFKTVAEPLAETIQNKKPLIISVAAGIQLKNIETWLGAKTAVVRAMPNTPALIGCGASGLFANEFVTDDQRNLAESVLRAVSVVVWLDDESLMDVVTALSGSGPAYFFLVIEALQNAAVKLGLPKDMARLLTLQTAYGASRMALESENDVKELRQQVTSPGGTTEAAIKELEAGNLRQIFEKAIVAATDRSKELAG